MGRVEISSENNFFVKIQATGNSGQTGQIAIDDFLIVDNADGCSIMPPEAAPKPPTTTPAPTEPPERKIYFCDKFFEKIFKISYYLG